MYCNGIELMSQCKIEEKEYNHEDTSIVRDLNLRGIARQVLISF